MKLKRQRVLELIPGGIIPFAAVNISGPMQKSVPEMEKKVGRLSKYEARATALCSNDQQLKKQ